MSSSGKGQSLVREPRPTSAAAWQYAESAGRVRGGRVIVEGFIDFDYEITLLTVRATRRRRRRSTTHFCEPIGHLQVDGDYVESWQPQPMSRRRAAKRRARSPARSPPSSAAAACSASSCSSGATRSGSPRSARGRTTPGMVTLCTQAQSEFELHARAILGLPVDTRLAAPARPR